MKDMKDNQDKTKLAEDILRRARIATGERVNDNELMKKVQDELNDIDAIKAARVSPRPKKKNE